MRNTKSSIRIIVFLFLFLLSPFFSLRLLDEFTVFRKTACQSFRDRLPRWWRDDETRLHASRTRMPELAAEPAVVPFPRYRHRWFSLLPGKFFYGSKKLCQVFRNIYEPCERYEDKTRLHAFAMANGHGVLSRHVPPRCLLAIFYISERLRLLCWDAHRIREYTTMKLASKQRKTKMVTRPLCNVQSFFRSLWSLASLKNYRPPMCFTDRFARNTVWKILFCVIIGYSCSCLNPS